MAYTIDFRIESNRFVGLLNWRFELENEHKPIDRTVPGDLRQKKIAKQKQIELNESIKLFTEVTPGERKC